MSLAIVSIVVFGLLSFLGMAGGPSGSSKQTAEPLPWHLDPKVSCIPKSF